MAADGVNGLVAMTNGLLEADTGLSKAADHAHVNGVIENGLSANGHLEGQDLATDSVSPDIGDNPEADVAAHGEQSNDLAPPDSDVDLDQGAVNGDPSPMNTGHVVANGLLGPPPVPVGDIPAFGEASSAAEKPVEKILTRHEYWLVKVPRPDVTAEFARMKTVQMIINEKKEKQNFISAALRLKQAARSEAQAALRGARERVRTCSAEVRKKFEEARPLQDLLRRLNEGRRDARAQGRSLEATSEAELNDLIFQKEHRMQHESISLNEEKQLMKEIKQLESSRAKVREMEELNLSVHEAMGQKDAIQTQLKPLLAEAELLKEERDAAQGICQTFEAEAKVCEEAVQELLDERAAVIQEQDTLYDELRALKAEAYKKEEDYRQYRRDLDAAQHMAVNKDVAALETFCSEQRERMHAKLNKDSTFRKRYVAANQWIVIRKFGTPDTRRLGVDEDPAVMLGHVAGGGGAGRDVGRAQADGREGRGASLTAGKGGEGQRGALERKGAALGAAAASSKKAAGAVAKEGPGGQAGRRGEREAAGEKAVSGEEEEAGTDTGSGRGKGVGVSGKAGRKVQSEEPALSAEEQAVVKEREEAEREIRRQEAVQKAKEAEERKRKQAERAQVKAEARAAKEAEEAARKREKEKERKARRKVSAAAEKAAAAAAASAAGDAADAEETEGAGAASAGGDGAAGAAAAGAAVGGAGEHLSKRQRKRLASGKGKADGEGEVASRESLKKDKKEGSSGLTIALLSAAGLLVTLAVVLLVYFMSVRSKGPRPVFAE